MSLEIPVNLNNIVSDFKKDIKSDSIKNGSYYQGPNNQFYYIEIILYNNIEGQNPLYVPFFLVESLTIHESMSNWATRGEIVFNTDFEVFSRGAPNQNNPPYIDRTDGRNKLHIKIYPVDVTNVNGNIEENNSEEKFPKEYWEINHDFVVMEVKDIPVDNNQRKKRMYIFIDERFQILKEKNLEWSSETISSKINNFPVNKILSDAEAALNPNIVLKELLTLVSTNGDTMPQINVGFDDSGSIANPNIPFDKIIENEWDIGFEENNVNFYITSKSNALDDLNYVLSHCVSNDKFPVILDYGRSSLTKGWTLKSISDYFKNSTPEQIEKLIIEDSLVPSEFQDAGPTPYLARASNSKGTETNNFSSIAASRITSYKYSPMMPLDDNRLQNSPLYYFNEHDGKFFVKKQENSIQNLYSKLKELCSGLYSFQQGQNAQVLLNINQTKSSGQMTTPKSALNGPYSNHISPLCQMILDAVFLNQSIAFQCLGLTIRTPGKFIFIDRLGAGEKNAFDDRFLGQWLITDVSHLFTQENYVTEVVATKLDAFSNVFPVEDSNY